MEECEKKEENIVSATTEAQKKPRTRRAKTEDTSVTTEEKTVKKPRTRKKTETKTEETATNVEDKPTEISVSKPESSSDDIDNTQIASVNAKNELSGDVFEAITEKTNKAYQEQLKNESFKEEDIIYEDEDKMIPVVTDEDIELFSAASDGVFTRNDFIAYINMAKEAINQFIVTKKNKEEGILDESDSEMYEDELKSANESKHLLMVIQNECRIIRNEFTESHIVEDTIRATVFNNLTDYTINKFKFNESWYKTNYTDKSKEISDSIKKITHFPTISKYWVDRIACKAKSSQNYNLFNPKNYSDMLDTIIWAIGDYIVNSPNKEVDVIAVEKIIEKDFKTMNFCKPIIAYSFIKNSLILDENSEDDKKILDSKSILAPTDNSEKLISELNTHIKNLIIALGSSDRTFNNLKRISEDFYNDLKTTDLKDGTLDLYNFEETCSYITGRLMTKVEESTINKWGEGYKVLYRYYKWYELNAFISNIERIRDKFKEEYNKDNNNLDAIFVKLCFAKFITPIVEHIMLYMYTDIVTDITNDVKQRYPKTVRSTMFATIVNNIILQHEFAFKQKIENPSEVNEKRYELAKAVFGDHYDYFVDSNIKNDIFLKEVDLLATRDSYIETTIAVIGYITGCLCTYNSSKVTHVVPVKNRKHKHNKRK